jgi:hypothetical protein
MADLWNQSDVRIVETLQVGCAQVELMAKCIKIMFNKGPALFHKKPIEPIRSRSFIWRAFVAQRDQFLPVEKGRQDPGDQM